MLSTEEEYREIASESLSQFLTVLDITKEDVEEMHKILSQCQQENNNLFESIKSVAENKEISEKNKRLTFFVMGIGCSEAAFEKVYNVKFEGIV